MRIRVFARRGARVLVAGCVALGFGDAYAAVSEPLAGWRGPRYEVSPQTLGFDSRSLTAAVAAIGEMEGVQSVHIQRGGYLVAERYWRGGARNRPHNLKSVTKSIVSALVGIAIDEGYLSLDQPIGELLDAARALDDPAKREITVRHLLTMTSGLESTSYRSYGSWVESENWVKAVLEAPLSAEPGTRYQYSTGSSHLLSAIIAEATGMSTRAYAESRLLDPLGIVIAGWAKDPQGVHVGGNNLSLLPRDWVKFGQLYLDQGRWGTRQIVPQRWIAASLRINGRDLHETHGGYGFLWWVQPGVRSDFSAVGFGGQLLVVSPRNDVVVAVSSTLESKGARWESHISTLVTEDIMGSLLPTQPVALAAEAFGPAAERRAEPVLASARVALSLRAVPSEHGERLQVLPPGTRFQVLGLEAGWLEVRAGDDDGWVHGDYVALLTRVPLAPRLVVRESPSLGTEEFGSSQNSSALIRTAATSGTPSDPGEPSAADLGALQAEVIRIRGLLRVDGRERPRYRTSGRVNFRATPGFKGERIRLLPPGTEFESLARSGNWVQARIDGVDGWVHTDFAIRLGPVAGPGLQSDLASIAGAVENLVARSRILELQATRQEEALVRVQDSLAQADARAARAEAAADGEDPILLALTARVEEADRERKALRVARDEALRSNEALGAQLTAAERDREKLEQAREALVAVEERLRTTETSRDEALHSNEALEAQVVAADRDHEKLEQAREALGVAEAQLAAAEMARDRGLRENDTLRTELEAARHAREGGESSGERLASLERSVETERSTTKSRLEHLGAEIRAVERLMAAGASEARSIRRTTNHVNLRASPSLSAARVALLSPGTEFDAIERDGPWLHAIVDGRDGWVHSDYAHAVEPTEPSPETADPETADPETAIVALRSTVEALVSKAHADGEQVARLEGGHQEELTAARLRASKLEVDLAARSERLDATAAQIETLEQELATATMLTAQTEASRADWLGKTLELERSLAETTGERGRLDQEVVDLRRVHEEVEARLKGFEEQEQVLEDELALAAQTRSELESRRDSADAQIVALESELALRSERLGATAARIAALEEALADAGKLTRETEALRADRLGKALELERSLTESTGEQERLISELHSAEARLATLEASVADSTAERGRLDQEVAGMLRQHEEVAVGLGQRAQELEEELALTAQIRSELESRRASADAQMVELESELGSQTERLGAAVARTAVLEEELATATKLTRETEASRADWLGKSLELERSLAESTGQRDRLTSELDSAGTRVTTLERTVEDSATQRGQLEQDVVRLRQQHEELEAGLAGSAKRGQVLEDELALAAQTRSELESKRDSADAQIVELESELALQTERLGATAVQVAALEEELAAATKLTHETEASRGDWEGKALEFERSLTESTGEQERFTSELFSAEARVATLEASVADSAAERGRFNQEVAGLRRQNEEVEARLAGSEQRGRDLEDQLALAARTWSELKASLEMQTERRGTVVAQIAALEEKLVAVTQLERETEASRADWEGKALELERSLAESTGEQERFTSELLSAETRVATLEASVADSAAQRGGFNQEVAGLRRQNEEVEVRLAGSEERARDLQDQLSLAARTWSELKASLEMQTERRGTMVAQIAALEEKLVAATQLARETQVSRADWVGKALELERSLAESTGEEERLTSELLSTEARVATLEASVANLAAERARLDHEGVVLRQERVVVESRLAESGETIQGLGDQLERLQRDNHEMQISLDDSMAMVAALDRAAAQTASEPGPAPADVIAVEGQPVPGVGAEPATAPLGLVEAIDTVVRSWAEAWSSQDVERYLARYGETFLPSGGKSRAAWKAQRRERLKKPKSISVEIRDLEVDHSGANRARATFVQDYRANHYQDRVRKTLLFAYSSAGWRIVQESSAPLEAE